MAALRLRLRAEGMGTCDESLEWALNELLQSVVAERLVNLRGRDGQLARLTPFAERRLLESDFQEGNVTLEAWSSLYYRFICPTLQLSTKQMSELVLPHHRDRSGDRLIQRRVCRAVHGLTSALREIERSAEKETNDALADDPQSARGPGESSPGRARSAFSGGRVGQRPPVCE